MQCLSFSVKWSDQINWGLLRLPTYVNESINIPVFLHCLVFILPPLIQCLFAEACVFISLNSRSQSRTTALNSFLSYDVQMLIASTLKLVAGFRIPAHEPLTSLL